MLRVARDRAVNAVVKGTKHRCTGHDANSGVARESLSSLVQPSLVLLILQPATQVGLLVTQNDSLTFLTGDLRCGQSRGAATHDQNIAVEKSFVVMTGVRLGG